MTTKYLLSHVNDVNLIKKTPHKVTREKALYLVFTLAAENYAVDITRLNGVKGWAAITPISETPENICGILNIREQIVPIIDIRKRFNLKEIPYSSITVVIILTVEAHNKTHSVGLIVDSLSEMIYLSPDNIEPAPCYRNPERAKVVTHQVINERQAVMLLNTDHILHNKLFSKLNKLYRSKLN